MCRAQETEEMEGHLRECKAEFVKSMNDELLCKHTTDALAAYLQLYSKGVLVNVEELEGLITTLSMEVD